MLDGMAERVEVLVSGFGGQGVVRVGQIISLGAVYDGLNTTMLVSHGTEMRGGYVRTQTVISKEPVDSPVVENPDFLCALSRAAYTRFSSLVSHGVILYDPAYVEPNPALKVKHLSVAARDAAVQNLGAEIYANVVLIGYLAKIMERVLRKETILQAMLERIPKFQDSNKRAFEIGYAIACEQV